MKKTNLTLLATAAWHFTQGINTAKGLSEVTGISEGRIYKWVKMPEWDKALDDLKFDGDRSLHREPRRSIQRDNADLIADAKVIYDASRASGKTPQKAVTAVCDALGLKRRRVNEWRDKLKWEGNDATEETTATEV